MKRVGKAGLSNALIGQICMLITSWEGKLTWSLLVLKIEEELNLRVTRQTLNNYFSIKNTFQVRKAQIRNQDYSIRDQIGINIGSDEAALLKRIEAQQRQIEALEAKLAKQLDQLKTFIFNVRNIPGVDISTLLIRKDRL
ncbi:MAG: hypothetical protein AAF431_02425 [Pseudomonadota bacterium]